jgi:hypothetical protein
MMVAASNIRPFRHGGDGMAAGSANQSPFPEAVIFFMLKERGPLLQVGQVIHVLLVRVLARGYFRDEGGQFMIFKILCHAH